jgi:hypothetical protein
MFVAPTGLYNARPSAPWQLTAADSQRRGIARPCWEICPQDLLRSLSNEWLRRRSRLVTGITAEGPDGKAAGPAHAGVAQPVRQPPAGGKVTVG